MDEQQWMRPLTAHIRALVQQRHFSEAESEAAKAMANAPHAAQPHNLMGIVSESRGDHVQAMKHFRAAWALDPTFLPARVNMERYGSFPGRLAPPAYDDADLPPYHAESRRAYRMEYDENGVGHVVRRNK